MNTFLTVKSVLVVELQWRPYTNIQVSSYHVSSRYWRHWMLRKVKKRKSLLASIPPSSLVPYSFLKLRASSSVSLPLLRFDDDILFAVVLLCLWTVHETTKKWFRKWETGGKWRDRDRGKERKLLTNVESFEGRWSFRKVFIEWWTGNELKRFLLLIFFFMFCYVCRWWC